MHRKLINHQAFAVADSHSIGEMVLIVFLSG